MKMPFNAIILYAALTLTSLHASTESDGLSDTRSSFGSKLDYYEAFLLASERAQVREVPEVFKEMAIAHFNLGKFCDETAIKRNNYLEALEYYQKLINHEDYLPYMADYGQIATLYIKLANLSQSSTDKLTLFNNAKDYLQKSYQMPDFIKKIAHFTYCAIVYTGLAENSQGLEEKKSYYSQALAATNDAINCGQNELQQEKSPAKIKRINKLLQLNRKTLKNLSKFCAI